jgi:hypothetical protein
MPRRISLALLLALLCSLLAGTAGSARAAQCEDCDPGGDPGGGAPGLGVTLTVGVGPTYGQALHATVATDKPGTAGSVSIVWERAGLADVVVASGAEGGFDIATAPRFSPGQTYYLRAYATKVDGSSGQSARAAFAVNPISTRLEFVGTTAAAPGTIRLSVFADQRTDIAPTGAVTLTTDGSFRGTIPLDGRGFASFPGFAPGTYQAVATYPGDAYHQAREASATITVWRMPATFTAQLSTSSATAGTPVSLRVTPHGGSAEHPPSGPWRLRAAPVAGGPGEYVAQGTSTGEPFDVDLTRWAAAHVGAWRLTFFSDGNAWVDGVTDLEVGQLTVTDRVVPPPPGPGDPGSPGTPGAPGTPGSPGTPGTDAPHAKGHAVVGGTLRRSGRTVTLSVVVTGSSAVTGTVEVRDGKRRVRTVALRGGRAVVRLKHLRKGRHRLTASYPGSPTLLGASHGWTVRIR